MAGATEPPGPSKTDARRVHPRPHSRHRRQGPHKIAFNSVEDPSDRSASSGTSIGRVHSQLRATFCVLDLGDPHLVDVATCADSGAYLPSHGVSASVTASVARSSALGSRFSISARNGEPSTMP